MRNSIVRTRNLPHIDVLDKPFFVTACLHGSINSKGLKRIRKYRDELSTRPKPAKYNESEWKTVQNKLIFKLVDSILDGEPAARHLENDRLAEIVQNAFLHFAGDRYRLFGFVVMPSHYHWVFLPEANWVEAFVAKRGSRNRQCTPRESICHSIQSYTGLRCNQALGQSGPFWQDETYDHYARDEEELMRIIDYIEQNPVVSGLVSKAEDYPWSSAALRKKLGLSLGDSIPRIA